MIPYSVKLIATILTIAIMLQFKVSRSQEYEGLPNTDPIITETSHSVNDPDQPGNNPDIWLNNYHIGFIPRINNDKFYNTTIKLYNLNCDTVRYEVILIDAKNRHRSLRFRKKDGLKIPGMWGKEHTISASFLRKTNARYFMVKTDNLDFKSKIEKPIKPLKIQIVYTRGSFTLIRDIPKTLMFGCN